MGLSWCKEGNQTEGIEENAGGQNFGHMGAYGPVLPKLDPKVCLGKFCISSTQILLFVIFSNTTALELIDCVRSNGQCLYCIPN